MGKRTYRMSVTCQKWYTFSHWIRKASCWVGMVSHLTDKEKLALKFQVTCLMLQLVKGLTNLHIRYCALAEPMLSPMKHTASEILHLVTSSNLPLWTICTDLTLLA